jgi:hypothetical protein
MSFCRKYCIWVGDHDGADDEQLGQGKLARDQHAAQGEAAPRGGRDAVFKGGHRVVARQHQGRVKSRPARVTSSVVATAKPHHHGSPGAGPAATTESNALIWLRAACVRVTASSSAAPQSTAVSPMNWPEKLRPAGTQHFAYAHFPGAAHGLGGARLMKLTAAMSTMNTPTSPAAGNR